MADWRRARFAGRVMAVVATVLTAVLAILAIRADGGPQANVLGRVSDGECVLDPTIVARLMQLQRQRPDSPLAHLSPRERDILALIAEGRSNAGAASDLHISERTVEASCAQLFRKLGLVSSPDLNRRVLAVPTLLRN